MSFSRSTPLLWGSLALALVCAASAAQAGELERCRLQIPADPQGASLDAPVTLGRLSLAADQKVRTGDDDELVPMGDLRLAADFHPETDRWTERHNRIRITLWMGFWGFSRELNVKNDAVVGLRLAWEVPGFIGIRWDSGVVPWSRLRVKAAPGTFNGVFSKRHINGYVHNHGLSLGIFNPELSVEGLAFWAGFGGGLWFYEYHESDLFGVDSAVDGDFSDTNISGNIFVELDYKIADIFHVGIGIREHILLAPHTDEGRFYEFNSVKQSFDSGRNAGPLDDLATVSVTELTFNISILF